MEILVNLDTYSGYDTKLDMTARLHFWGELSTSSLPLLPGRLWPSVVVSLRVILCLEVRELHSLYVHIYIFFAQGHIKYTNNF